MSLLRRRGLYADSHNYLHFSVTYLILEHQHFVPWSPWNTFGKAILLLILCHLNYNLWVDFIQVTKFYDMTVGIRRALRSKNSHEIEMSISKRSFISHPIKFLTIFNTFGWSILEIFDQGLFGFGKIGVLYSN